MAAVVVARITDFRCNHSTRIQRVGGVQINRLPSLRETKARFKMSHSERKRIQFYYDVLSPYSWIAFEILCRYRERWNIELEFCPFLLGGVMKATNNSAPGKVPAKAAYMGKDLSRLGEYYQVPFHVPKNVEEVMFKKGSLSAQRFLLAALSECPEKVEELSRQLWLRIWSQDIDITERDSLLEAGKKSGISIELLNKMADMIKTEEIKEKLKKQTQDAVDLGSFGAPFMVVHMEDGRKEIFFGCDRMELMAHVIGEKWEGPIQPRK